MASNPNDSSVDDVLAEVIAHAELILQSAESCPHLLEIGRLLEDKAADRGGLVGAYIDLYLPALTAELHAIGVELHTATLEFPQTSRSTGTDVDNAGEFQTAIEEEISEKETFADSNRARSYVNSTF